MPRLKKAPLESEQKEQKITIPGIGFKVARITIVGESPLLVNRFDEKSKREMEDKVQKRAKTKKEYGSPEEQAKKALYVLPGTKNKYGVPAAGLKNCAVSACRFLDGVPMTIARGSFQVIGDIGGLIPLDTPGWQIDERICRVGNFGNKKPCVRYRPRFDKWKITFAVKYNSGVISAEQLANLYEHAGFSVGLHEYRPEKNGNCGMFSVQRSH